MENKYIFVNDQFILHTEAKLHVSDLSIQRGYGIFDFLKTIDFHPVFIDDYLDRFYRSAKEMNLEPPYERNELKSLVRQLIEKNNIANSGIKLILTGGFSEDGFTITTKPNFMMVQSPLNIGNESFEKGLKLITNNFQRQVPSVKTIDYLQAIKTWPQVIGHHADDILYHKDGAVRECPRANIFMVKGKEVFTPKTDILRGITRSKVLSLETAHLNITERDFSLEELQTADEVFITVTTKNICPVLQIDGKPVNEGNIGEITRSLSVLLQQLINKDIDSKNGF
ncbi:aminotransferase class IV [Pedobacter montanisoli]|uniref:branched-chain-amino-acid transaminase n=1 Tax=Pedobacter montanisoli TaxID=2923277 RepID=A0ABT0A036_9SPHI|nr:aminotransferase class IV [Pedobacter montanisoli]MCJ0743919.1 aminotransferase class IV [Pedobacter montanisoli]